MMYEKTVYHKPVLNLQGESYHLICICGELEDKGNLEKLHASWISHRGNTLGQEFDPFTDAILRADVKLRKANDEEKGQPVILFKEHLDARDRREKQVDATQIDGSLTNFLKNNDRPVDASGDGQKMYNRCHPKGRRVNSKEQRAKHGASYYR